MVARGSNITSRTRPIAVRVDHHNYRVWRAMIAATPTVTPAELMARVLRIMTMVLADTQGDAWLAEFKEQMAVMDSVGAEQAAAQRRPVDHGDELMKGRMKCPGCGHRVELGSTILVHAPVVSNSPLGFSKGQYVSVGRVCVACSEDEDARAGLIAAANREWGGLVKLGCA